MHKKRQVSVKIQPMMKANTYINLADFAKGREGQIDTVISKAAAKRFEDVYSLGTSLGQGGSSVVKKATDKKGQTFAVKILKSADPEKLLAQIVEFRIMHRLKHPNIIKAYELFVDEDKSKTAMVMDYIEGKSLQDVIAHYNGSVPENMAATLFGMILDALEYLHAKQVCHRDIHPNNILVSNKHDIAKIIDFNVAKYYGPVSSKDNSMMDKSATTRMMTQTGNIFYRPPEVLLGGVYTEKVDMWSAGLVLYQMFYGFNPLAKEGTVAGVLAKISSNSIDFNEGSGRVISVQAKDFLRQLLEVDPSKRLSARDALRHPWFLRRGCLVTPKTLPRSLSQLNCRGLLEDEEESSGMSMLPQSLAYLIKKGGSKDVMPSVFIQKNLITAKRRDGDFTDFADDAKKIDFPTPGAGNLTSPYRTYGSERATDEDSKGPSPFNSAPKIPNLDSSREVNEQEPKKINSAYLDKMQVFVQSNTKDSELTSMLQHYHGYFEELKMIKFDRSFSLSDGKITKQVHSAALTSKDSKVV